MRHYLKHSYFLIGLATFMLAFLCLSQNLAHADIINNIKKDPTTPFVIDNASVLDENTKLFIQHHNEDLSKVKDSPQILVVTIKSLEGESIDELAVKIGKKFKIGDKENNTGLVYLVSVNDHKNYLTTGYGLESRITDITASDICQNITVKSAYKVGDYSTGTYKAIELIIPFLKGEKKPKTASNKSTPFIIIIVLGLVLLDLFIAIIRYKLQRNNHQSNYFLDYFLTYMILSTLLHSFFGGNNSGGGDSNDWFGDDSNFGGGDSGGWSGGGGDFGGGGGGGDW